MVLLGGAQSPFGGALGTTLLILLPEWLKEMPPSLQFIKDVYLAIYGLAVILIMVFMPEGIWGLLRNGWNRFRTRDPVDTSGIKPLHLDIAVTETTRCSGSKACRSSSAACARSTASTSKFRAARCMR